MYINVYICMLYNTNMVYYYYYYYYYYYIVIITVIWDPLIQPH